MSIEQIEMPEEKEIIRSKRNTFKRSLSYNIHKSNENLL